MQSLALMCLPRSHDICCQCCVCEFFFAVQEWVAIKMNMSIVALKEVKGSNITQKGSVLYCVSHLLGDATAVRVSDSRSRDQGY